MMRCKKTVGFVQSVASAERKRMESDVRYNGIGVARVAINSSRYGDQSDDSRH